MRSTVVDLAAVAAGLVVSSGAYGTVDLFDAVSGAWVGVFADAGVVGDFEDCEAADDADGDGAAGCADSDCAGTSLCDAAGEACGNAADDDGDGAVDCADPDCAGQASCQVSFTGPTAMAVDRDGSLLVVQHKAAGIYRFEGTSGAFLGMLSGDARAWQALAVDDAGVVYAATYDAVYAFDPDGAPRGIVVAASAGLAGVAAMACGPGGDLYVGDDELGAVWRFDATGALVAAVLAGVAPRGLAFDGDGDLCVTTASTQVTCYDPDTGASRFTLTSSGSAPAPDLTRLTRPGAAALWALDRSSHRVEAFRIHGNSATRADACRPGCLAPTCGNGKQQSGEDCDSGGVDAAGCDADCTTPSCGDGHANAAAGEGCDDGAESAACNADCTPASCGDGKVNAAAGEACDAEGEAEGCDDDCTVVECGDGLANHAAGEACDDGGETAHCDADCTLDECGDGTLNTTAGEVCEDGVETAACNHDCTAASCGDGVPNAAAGEDCDDRGESATCDVDCSAARCGDGVLNRTAGEACDGGEACTSECTFVQDGKKSGGCQGGGGEPDALVWATLALLAWVVIRRRPFQPRGSARATGSC